MMSMATMTTTAVGAAATGVSKGGMGGMGSGNGCKISVSIWFLGPTEFPSDHSRRCSGTGTPSTHASLHRRGRLHPRASSLDLVSASCCWSLSSRCYDVPSRSTIAISSTSTFSPWRLLEAPHPPKACPTMVAAFPSAPLLSIRGTARPFLSRPSERCCTCCSLPLLTLSCCAFSQHPCAQVQLPQQSDTC